MDHKDQASFNRLYARVCARRAKPGDLRLIEDGDGTYIVQDATQRELFRGDFFTTSVFLQNLPKIRRGDPNAPREHGRLVHFNCDRGYGFIKADNPNINHDVFVHKENCLDEIRNGDSVKFILAPSRTNVRHQHQAEEVELCQ